MAHQIADPRHTARQEDYIFRQEIHLLNQAVRHNRNAVRAGHDPLSAHGGQGHLYLGAPQEVDDHQAFHFFQALCEQGTHPFHTLSSHASACIAMRSGGIICFFRLTTPGR